RIYFDIQPKVFRAPTKKALLRKILQNYNYTLVSTNNGIYYRHPSAQYVRVFSLQKFRRKTSRDTIELWSGYERTITSVTRRGFWEANVYDMQQEFANLFNIKQEERTFKLSQR